MGHFHNPTPGFSSPAFSLPFLLGIRFVWNMHFIALLFGELLRRLSGNKPCLNSSAVSAHWGQVVLPQPLPGSPLTTSPHGAGPVRLLALSARLWSQPTYFASSHACLYRWDLLPSLVHLRGIS